MLIFARIHRHTHIPTYNHSLVLVQTYILTIILTFFIGIFSDTVIVIDYNDVF